MGMGLTRVLGRIHVPIGPVHGRIIVVVTGLLSHGSLSLLLGVVRGPVADLEEAESLKPVWLVEENSGFQCASYLGLPSAFLEDLKDSCIANLPVLEGALRLVASVQVVQEEQGFCL
jgi:hypothetical protein